MAGTCSQIGGGCRTFFCHQGIKFIVTFEFLQRFSFYGVQAMMFLFVKHELGLQLHMAIAVVHLFGFVHYTSPLLGSMFADITVGRFAGLILDTLVALAGILMIILAAAAEGIGYTADDKRNFVLAMSICGFLLHAIGGGAMNCSISDFGRDQFLSNEQKLKAQFYALFFHALSLGTITAVILSPMLRMGLQCAGLPYCFPAGFIASMLVLICGLVVLIVGSGTYHYAKRGRSIIMETLTCIIHARSNAKNRRPGEHWLDCATDDYVPRFIKDVKQTLHALWLYIPLPIFWALFEQMWSRWIFQATTMDGTIDEDYGLEPDSMPFLNPLIMTLVLPVVELVIMPLCFLCRVCRTPKIRIVIGGVLAVLAYVVAAQIELKLEPTFYKPVQAGEGEIMFWNAAYCNISVYTTIPGFEEFKLEGENYKRIRIPMKDKYEFTVKDYVCRFGYVAVHYTLAGKKVREPLTVNAYEGVTSTFLFEVQAVYKFADVNKTKLLPHQFWYPTPLIQELPFTDYSRSELQLAKVAFMVTFTIDKYAERDTGPIPMPDNHLTIVNLWDNRSSEIIFDYNHRGVNFSLWQPRKYEMYGISVDKPDVKKRKEFQLKRNGLHIISYRRSHLKPLTLNAREAKGVSPNATHNPYIETNSVPIWWQVPQYICITLAQLLYPVCILEYSYTQAHRRMRTVLLTMWLLTVALGNLIVAIISLCNMFSRELHSYYFYAGLMVVDLVVLVLVLLMYTDWKGEVDKVIYLDEEEEDDEEDD